MALDQRLIIEESTTTKSATSGEDIETWPPSGGSVFATVWAEIEIPQGHNTKAVEMFKAGRESSDTWYAAKIRRLAGVTTKMRGRWTSSLHGEVILDIRAVEAKRDRAEYMILTCRVVE